jgi:hypothetical protein
MTARYGVVIVNAGVKEWDDFTVNCYRTLGINTRIDYDLCLVDNGGLGRGQVNFPDMIPYAEAANAGAACLANERLVILNNDITFNGDLLFKLEQYSTVRFGGAVSLIKEGVEYIEGWCIVIDNELWKLMNGFDTEYKNSWEDVDLAFRLSKMNIHPRVIPIPCHHIWGATRNRYPGSNKWDEQNRQRLLSRIRGEL